MNILQELAPGINPMLTKKILDGTFCHWELQKIKNRSSSVQYATPPRTPMSHSSNLTGLAGAFTSHAPSFDQDWKLFRKEFKEEKKKNKAERKKNKKFRTAVRSFLQTIAGCLSSPLVNLPTYESSPERTTSEEVKQKPKIKRKGKVAVVVEPSSSDEELDDSEDDKEEKATNKSDEEEEEEEEDDDEDDNCKPQEKSCN